MEEKIREMKKKFPQFIGLDFYKVADVALVLFIVFVLMLFERRDKFVTAGILGSGFAWFALTSMQFAFGKTKVDNRYKGNVFANPENGTDPFKMPNGIDGVKVNGVVYKISDGCHAVINRKGKVVINSITGKFMNFAMGGGILTTRPDDGWKDLFKAGCRQEPPYNDDFRDV